MAPLTGLAATTLLFLAADGHRQTDKAQHFLLSALYGGAVGLALREDPKLDPLRRLVWAAGLGSVPGLIKEYIDQGQAGNRFDSADLWADLTGALGGALLVEVLSESCGLTAEDRHRLDYP